jgi:hypothetical protein
VQKILRVEDALAQKENIAKEILDTGNMASASTAF